MIEEKTIKLMFYIIPVFPFKAKLSIYLVLPCCDSANSLLTQPVGSGV